MLLNKKAAAAILGICTDTLSMLTNNGEILGFKVGGQWRFDKRDIENYIDRQRQQAVHRRIDTRSMLKAKRPPVDKNITPAWIPGMKIQNVCGQKCLDANHQWSRGSLSG